jgi:serine/threonine protein kinase
LKGAVSHKKKKETELNNFFASFLMKHAQVTLTLQPMNTHDKIGNNNGRHRIIGSGSYGNIFKPSLASTSRGIEQRDEWITKVQEKRYAKRELRMLNLLKRLDIDPKENYFCHTIQSGVFDIAHCDEKPSSIPLTYMAMNFVYGGLPILSFLEEAQEKACRAQDLLTAFAHVARGIAWLHSHKIYHFDIKPSNMVSVWSQHAGIPCIRLIDFGLSTTLQSLETRTGKDVLYSASYVYWPLEMSALGKKSQSNLTSKEDCLAACIVAEVASNEQGRYISSEAFALSEDYKQWIQNQLTSPDVCHIAPRTDTYGLVLSFILCVWRYTSRIEFDSSKTVYSLLFSDLIPELSLASNGSKRKDARELAAYFIDLSHGATTV